MEVVIVLGILASMFFITTLAMENIFYVIYKMTGGKRSYIWYWKWFFSHY